MLKIFKSLIILISFFLLNSCSEYETNKTTKLIEICADNALFKKFDSVYSKAHINVYQFTEAQKGIKKILNEDLQTKLSKYKLYKYKKGPNIFSTSDDVTFPNKISATLTYEQYFERCELDSKTYPIKFKQQWENYEIPYSPEWIKDK